MSPDVQLVFGGAKSIQAATVETAEHRDLYELIGRDHSIEHWYHHILSRFHHIFEQNSRKTPDERPGLIPFETREYSPGELELSERWIVEVFEPIRLA